MSKKSPYDLDSKNRGDRYTAPHHTAKAEDVPELIAARHTKSTKKYLDDNFSMKEKYFYKTGESQDDDLSQSFKTALTTARQQSEDGHKTRNESATQIPNEPNLKDPTLSYDINIPRHSPTISTPRPAKRNFNPNEFRKDDYDLDQSIHDGKAGNSSKITPTKVGNQI